MGSSFECRSFSSLKVGFWLTCGLRTIRDGEGGLSGQLPTHGMGSREVV